VLDLAALPSDHQARRGVSGAYARTYTATTLGDQVPKLIIKDTAERLGISEVTVRRRLKRGELIGEQVPTAQGYTWLVVLAGDGEPVTSLDNEKTTATVDHMLVEEVRAQVDYLKQELTERKREHDWNRDDWREELQRVHTLMAQ
jgi:hypothetical protein